MSVPVDPRSREDGFEHQDANVKVLLVIGFGLLATLVAGLLGVGMLIGYYNSEPEARVTALERDTIIPPRPRLESDAHRNAKRVIGEAEERLRHYAWADREAGIARIPLERARALLRERGWPAPVEARGDEDIRLQQAKRRAEP